MRNAVCNLCASAQQAPETIPNDLLERSTFQQKLNQVESFPQLFVDLYS